MIVIKLTAASKMPADFLETGTAIYITAEHIAMIYRGDGDDRTAVDTTRGTIHVTEEPVAIFAQISAQEQLQQ